MKNSIVQELVDLLKEQISSVSNVDDQIDLLNEIRLELHSVSPLKHHPVDCVLWIKSDDVEVNEYNPNKMDKLSLDLLHTSVSEDGYTMSIVTDKTEEGKIKVVDGAHRRLIEKTFNDISESTKGRIPLTFIRNSQKDIANRMASTIRHNRARGVHSIDLMSNIVGELVQAGMSDAWIQRHLGMDREEMLRLKQITGLASLFADIDFSKAWDEKEMSIELDEENEGDN